MVYRTFLLIGLLASMAFGDTGFKDLIRISDIDGTPGCMAGQVKFSNGAVACAGNVATVTTGSSSVAQLLQTASTSSGTITNANTYIAAGPSQAITLSKTTNKVRIFTNMDYFTRANTSNNLIAIELTIYRDSTNIALTGERISHQLVNNDDNNRKGQIVGEAIDAPGDTSAHTYQARVRVHSDHDAGNGAIIVPWITAYLTVEEILQ